MSPVFILHANDQIHSKTYVNMSSDGSLFPPCRHLFNTTIRWATLSNSVRLSASLWMSLNEMLLDAGQAVDYTQEVMTRSYQKNKLPRDNPHLYGDNMQTPPHLMLFSYFSHIVCLSFWVGLLYETLVRFQIAQASDCFEFPLFNVSFLLKLIYLYGHLFPQLFNL